MNQEGTRKAMLTEIRAKHLEQIAKAAENKPYGKADRHCIAAWTEIEAEDRADMEKNGVPPQEIESKLLEERAAWIASTTAAWEAAQPKKRGAVASEAESQDKKD